jgi:hypothetical protein
MNNNEANNNNNNVTIVNDEINYDSDRDSRTSSEYERECEIINNMFPNASFSICIDLRIIDEVVTDEEQIIVKSTYDCYCYDDYPRNTDYFYISGSKITNKYILEELIRQNLELDCNHQFVEGFQLNPNSKCEYILCTGS